MYVIINKNEKELYMIDLKEKTDDIKELEIPEIKKKTMKKTLIISRLLLLRKKVKSGL